MARRTQAPKLTDYEVWALRLDRQAGMTYKELSYKWRRRPANLQQIVTGVSYAQAPGPTEERRGDKRFKPTLTPTDIAICKVWIDRKRPRSARRTYRQLGQMYGVSAVTIYMRVGKQKPYTGLTRWDAVRAENERKGLEYAARKRAERSAPRIAKPPADKPPPEPRSRSHEKVPPRPTPEKKAVVYAPTAEQLDAWLRSRNKRAA
jgi:hypothetical protein